MKTSVYKYIKKHKGVILTLLFYSFTRTAIADWSPVPTGSMEPTIIPGDVLLIEKTLFGPSIPFVNKKLLSWGQVERGDIITFIPPHKNTLYVKRVIGVPGDTVRIAGENVFVNNNLLSASLLSDNNGAIQLTEVLDQKEHSIQYSHNRGINLEEQVFIIPANKYFVMGDHRNNSEDSRYWGYVDEENIMGKVNRLLISFSSSRNILGSIGEAVH